MKNMYNMEEIEALDKLKTQVLKYVLYKKRSEAEVREKFSKNSGNMLDDVIEFLKENDYINDKTYIEKTVNELMRLKNLSMKEIKYKLLAKGLDKSSIEDYLDEKREELIDYELNSAKQIASKKQMTMEQEKVIEYLRKKGYRQEIIKMIETE